MNDDPTDEELKTRQGCAEVFFRCLGCLGEAGCIWFTGALAFLITVPIWMN